MRRAEAWSDQQRTAILPLSMDYVQYSHREAGRLLKIGWRNVGVERSSLEVEITEHCHERTSLRSDVTMSMRWQDMVVRGG
jgi:hypothetical protein